MITRIIIIGLTIVGFIGCSKENKDNNIIYSAWPIAKVEGATTGTINQPIPITVSWPYSSGCDLVDKFAESNAGNTVTITTLGYKSKGICTMDTGIKTIIYNFTTKKSGVYELKFVNHDSFITHVVIIN